MNPNLLRAKQGMNQSFVLDDSLPADPGSPSNPPAPSSGSGWNWSAAWNGITHIVDSLVPIFSNRNYYTYPPGYDYRTQQQNSTLLTYGVGAVLLVIALALVYKITK
jgi:hypothetical protein